LLPVHPCACVRPSVSQFVRYQTCERDNLNTKELILMQIGTSGLLDKGMIRLTLGSGGQKSQSHEAKMGHRNPFRQDVSRTVRHILTKVGGHIIYGKSSWCHKNLDTEGQRSRSHEDKYGFGGLVEMLFLTPLDQVAFLVCLYYLQVWLLTCL